MIDRGVHNLLGVRVSAVDGETVVERVIGAAVARRALTVTATAVHGLTLAAIDREQRYRLNRFDLVVPDGQPVRWALNWLYRTRLRERVYGPDLMLRLCARAREEGLGVFLYGGTAPRLGILADRLRARYPGLQVAGTSPSAFRPLSPAERDAQCARIAASGARLAFIGIGCPRQEVWAFENAPALSMPVVAVGAAFAIHAGELPQAPRALQDRGLEWAYRLWREPRRLWTRYALLNPLYLALLLLQRVAMYVIDPESGVEPRRELRPG